MIKKLKRRLPLEKDIESLILSFLNILPSCFAWKNNSTGVYDPAKSLFRKNKNKWAINGVSDILGIINGKPLAIEVKRSDKEKPSRDQLRFINRILKLGGIAGVCSSIEDVRRLLHSNGIQIGDGACNDNIEKVSTGLSFISNDGLETKPQEDSSSCSHGKRKNNCIRCRYERLPRTESNKEGGNSKPSIIVNISDKEKIKG